MRRMLLLVPAAAAALLLAGCGGGGGGNPNQGNLGEQAGVSGNNVTIILKDFTLTPNSISLPKTGTYTFKGVNEGAQTHSLEVEGKGIQARGKNIGFGKDTTFTVKLTKPGKYDIYCPVDGHRSFGMEGTVKVG
jgi:uncharacterized cupredoxin-like copper-binding protein